MKNSAFLELLEDSIVKQKASSYLLDETLDILLNIQNLKRVISIFTIKSLINTHALINTVPPIWTLKFVIFGASFGQILASYKRPSEKMGGGGGGIDLFFCSQLPNALYLINQQTSFFFFHSPKRIHST